MRTARWRWAGRRRWEQRGAAALVMALVTCFVVVPMGALVIDLGMQRVARSDMQAIADTVALDMASDLAANDAANYPVTDAAATTDAQRNHGAVGHDQTIHVFKGYVSGALPADQSRGCGGSPYDSSFQSPSAGHAANAVLVTASTTVDFGLAKALPGGGVASGGACRSAVASAVPSACFKVGSFAARLDSSNSALLGKLLDTAVGGSGLGVTAAGYQGLATASIGLADLATQLGVGTVDQLATANVSVASIALAEAAILTRNGDTADAAVLTAIAAKVGALGTIALGNVAAVSGGGASAAGASINALDLIAGSLALANGTHLLTIPSLATNLGLTGTSLAATVKLIEGLQLACGKVGRTATTSQADVAIAGTLASIATPAALSGLTLSASTPTNIDLHLASATGTLTNIVCGAATSASPEGIDVSVQADTATVNVSQKISFSGSITSGGVLGGLLGGLLGSILEVDISGTVLAGATLGPNGSTSSVGFRIPNDPTTYATAKSTGSGGLGSATLVTSLDTSGLTITATGLLGLGVSLSTAQLNQILSTVTSSLTSSVVNPLVSSLMSGLVTPLAQLLGLTLGGADVYAVPRPRCANGQLIG